MLKSENPPKTVFITGVSSGLGKSILLECLEKGWKVIGTGRNSIKPDLFNRNFIFYHTDFSNLKQTASVLTRICSEHKPDYVINNAGILSPPEYIRTYDGFELSTQVNFISHLLINEIIIRSSEKSKLPLFFTVISPVFRNGDPERVLQLMRNDSSLVYRPLQVYSDTKLMLVQMTEYFNRRTEDGSGIFISFNPGVFSSGIYRTQKGWFRFLYKVAAPFMRSPSIVAKSIVNILEDNDLKSGSVYSINGKFKPSHSPGTEFAETVELLINEKLDVYISNIQKQISQCFNLF